MMRVCLPMVGRKESQMLDALKGGQSTGRQGVDTTRLRIKGRGWDRRTSDQAAGEACIESVESVVEKSSFVSLSVSPASLVNADGYGYEYE